MKRYIWMKISHDAYELPEAVADTAEELAAICGTTKNCICSSIAHVEKGKRKWSPYVKVEIEEREKGERYGC